jgi:hypothetical protein
MIAGHLHVHQRGRANDEQQYKRRQGERDAMIQRIRGRDYIIADIAVFPRYCGLNGMELRNER